MSPITPPHRAFQLDTAVRRWRARRALEDGYVPSVIPYTGYGSTSWLRVLCRVVLSRPDRRPSLEPEGLRGWRNFTRVPVENAVVRVEVASKTYELTANQSGIVDTVIDARVPPGWQTFTVTAEGAEPTTGKAFVVDPAVRFGLVSDIDDTVMVTVLPRPLLAAYHTFVLNEHARATTPGMPVLYERLANAHPDAPVIYLSTGAWNVAPTLTRFLSRNLYPLGALLLTDWGPTETGWFRSGRDHKRNSLERLATEFPQIRWLLIGDDGQHDESIYAEFAKAHPDNVAAICIRQLTPGEAVLAGSALRGHPATEGSPAPWAYSNDGAGLAEELEKLNVLPAAEREVAAEG